MTEFADFVWEERRLLILQLLDSQVDGSAGDRTLVQGLRAMGHEVTLDQVQTHLAWLSEQRIVNLIKLNGGLLSASITQRGSDLAKGRSSVPGVLREGRV